MNFIGKYKYELNQGLFKKPFCGTRMWKR